MMTDTIPASARRSMPLAQSLGSIVVVLVVAGLLAAAGSHGGQRLLGMPAFLLAGVIAFLVQWVAFVPAYIRQTEHYFDLTGSLTYISLALFGLWVGGDALSLLLATLILVWAGRLGTFLFNRVKRSGADRRFNSIKPDFFQFLMVWTLQGLWVFLTISPALAAMTGEGSRSLGFLAWLGAAIWVIGFLIEVVADNQKSRFRSTPGNENRFIQSGVWAWSQHPNYFGEILLWCGIALIAVPALSGWQWVTMISPLFVYLLLTRISGIRMLDNRARRQWGDDPEYQAYRRRTSRLVPLPPRGLES